MSKVHAIAVIDGNGDELTVYEFEDRRFIRKIRKLRLDSGESVSRLDADTFVLPTGERLTRAGPS